MSNAEEIETDFEMTRFKAHNHPTGPGHEFCQERAVIRGDCLNDDGTPLFEKATYNPVSGSTSVPVYSPNDAAKTLDRDKLFWKQKVAVPPVNVPVRVTVVPEGTHVIVWTGEYPQFYGWGGELIGA